MDTLSEMSSPDRILRIITWIIPLKSIGYTLRNVMSPWLEGRICFFCTFWARTRLGGWPVEAIQSLYSSVMGMVGQIHMIFAAAVWLKYGLFCWFLTRCM